MSLGDIVGLQSLALQVVYEITRIYACAVKRDTPRVYFLDTFRPAEACGTRGHYELEVFSLFYSVG